MKEQMPDSEVSTGVNTLWLEIVSANGDSSTESHR